MHCSKYEKSYHELIDLLWDAATVKIDGKIVRKRIAVDCTELGFILWFGVVIKIN